MRNILFFIMLFSGCCQLLAGCASTGGNPYYMKPKIYPHTHNRNAKPDLWSTVKHDFTLKHYSLSPQVQNQIAWFQQHPGHFYSVTKRAVPYMYYIHEKIQANHVPGELALLPMIESAFNPTAYSRAGASGLWQFMPRTARDWGIRTNYWFDGRRDVISSTDAAVNYLNYLGRYFNNDWLLAIAAYNAGENRVANATQRNGQMGRNREFWSLDLPMETQAYVPKLLAIAHIVEDPERYGFHLPPAINAQYLGVVKVHTQMNLAKIAQMAGMSKESVRQLNPGFCRAKTLPHQECKLLIPLSRLATFVSNLSITHRKPTQYQKKIAHHQIRSTYQQNYSTYHNVKAGETLWKIASRYGVPVETIRRRNNMRNNELHVGQNLLIPGITERV